MKNMTSQKIANIVNQTLSKHKDIAVEVCPSVSTNSVYVTLSKNGVKTCFRISDHMAPKYRDNVKKLIITKSTTSDHMIRFIENSVQTLQAKSFEETWKACGNTTTF